MRRPPSILLLALVSALGGLLFLSNTVVGNNWLIDSILSPPSASQGLLPIANAIGKDLMLDVSPQLHPSTLVGESANQIKFQHWIDNEIHCEDCLRLDIPNNGKKAGAAFSSNGAVFNFEEAKKMSFYVMGEVAGAKVNFKAVGNDKGNNAGGVGAGGGRNNSSNNNNLFTNQEFAVSSQNVTLNQTWNYLEMNLEGAQQKLANVKYPFGLEVAQGKGNAVTVVYLKGITYSSEPVQQEYLLEPSSANTTATSLPMTSEQTTPTTSLNITLQDNATESVNAPATVEFNATATDGQEPYSFDWDFKDGNAIETDTDGNIAHTFVTPGLYNVTVNVRDSLNSTGSSATLVEVVEDETVADQPATGAEDNSTQGLQQPTTGASNNTNNNITSPLGDIGDNETDEEEVQEEPLNQTGTGDVNTSEDGSINDGEANDTSANTGTGTNTGSDITVSNSPPVANAGRDIVGVPNQQIILDASTSSDPDAGDTIVSYLWEQESGPTAEINDQASATPVVTLPNVDEDSTIVFSLTVNDGNVDSEEQDTVSILIDHIEPLPNNNNIQQRVLKPSDIAASQWTPSGGCAGEIQCLSDGSHATFVAAGTENTDNVNLYSFGAFDGGAPVTDPNSLVIERVVAEIYAKKLGNTGYVSFAVDDPAEEEHYFTPSISIGSSSFQKYYQVWDTNPVTGEAWTYDSLNSLVAGFRYDGGQSGVEISELQLTVSYYLQAPEAVDPVIEAEPAPSTDPNNAEQTAGDGAAEEEENDENGTNGVQDTEEEEEDSGPQQTDGEGEDDPALEPESTNAEDVNANDAEGADSPSDESEE
jgi:PKD repeat protein